MPIFIFPNVHVSQWQLKVAMETKVPCLKMLHMKFGKNWLYGFRGVVIWKCWPRMDNDRYLVINSPTCMSLQLKWAIIISLTKRTAFYLQYQYYFTTKIINCNDRTYLHPSFPTEAPPCCYVLGYPYIPSTWNHPLALSFPLQTQNDRYDKTEEVGIFWW